MREIDTDLIFALKSHLKGRIVVISLCLSVLLFVRMSDFKLWTSIPICLKFWLGNWLKILSLVRWLTFNGKTPSRVPKLVHNINNNVFIFILFIPSKFCNSFSQSTESFFLTFLKTTLDIDYLEFSEDKCEVIWVLTAHCTVCTNVHSNLLVWILVRKIRITLPSMNEIRFKGYRCELDLINGRLLNSPVPVNIYGCSLFIL